VPRATTHRQAAEGPQPDRFEGLQPGRLEPVLHGLNRPRAGFAHHGEVEIESFLPSRLLL